MSESATKRKIRPRRIAADEAHAWARNLRLANPYAKLVLSMLTLYVNGEGSCFVGAASLAEDCELALETVRRRLGWLEQVGAIARFPQWIDENGKRNSDGRGRRTTDDIRLMMGSDPEMIEARACGDIPPESGVGNMAAAPVPDRGLADENQSVDAAISPPSGRGQTASHASAENRLAPPLGVCQPPHCGGGLDSTNREPESEESPLPPKGGDGPDDQDQDEVEGWSEFKAAFEADGVPILRVSIAKTLFAAHGPEQRARATKAAKGLIAFRASEKKPGAKPSAQTFLRETDAWEAFEKLAPKPPEKYTTVTRGDDGFRAAAVYKMITQRLPLKTHKVELSEARAQSADFKALAQFAAADGTVDRDNWVILGAEGSVERQQLAAWRERIHEWTGSWIEFEEIPELDETGTPIVSITEFNGRRLEFPKRREVLIVPTAWPPAKGTGNAAAEPATTLANDAELNEFAKTG